MPKRVMIVDPNLYNRMVLSNILATNGCSVCCEVSNCADALAKYERARPDVVFVESQMADRDGIATITELCRNFDGCTVILLASAGQRARVCEALSAGAVDFVAKPINERRVATVLKKL